MTIAPAPKYDPLREHLAAAAARGQRVVDMDFDQVADVVGGLPASAYQYRVCSPKS